MNLADMTRADLEVAVLEYDILPTATAADLSAVSALDLEALRAKVGAWIEAGDECAGAGW